MNPAVPAIAVSIVTLLLALGPETLAYSSGAPSSNATCDSMDPTVGHEKGTQNTPLPYKLSVVRDMHRDLGVHMTLSALGNHTFKGFMVQVRLRRRRSPKGHDEDHRPYGIFSIAELDFMGGERAKTAFANCSGSAASMATHTDNSDKMQVSFDWEAPSWDSIYEVFGTVVMNRTKYWVKQKMGRVEVVDGRVQLVASDCTSGSFGHRDGGIIVVFVVVLVTALVV